MIRLSSGQIEKNKGVTANCNSFDNLFFMLTEQPFDNMRVAVN
jgi:hypothetical protein